MRGQISTEYLLVVGLAFLLMLPAGYVFYSYSQEQLDTLENAEITSAGQTIVSEAESMYTVGAGSWTTVRIQFPESVSNVRANSSEVTVTYETEAGKSEAVFFSRVDLTTPYPGGNVSPGFEPGFTELRIQSNGSAVEVRETFE